MARESIQWNAQAEGTIDFRNMRIKEIGYELFRDPKELKGEGWSAKDDILSGNSKLTTPKSYKNCTLRIEFRGKRMMRCGGNSNRKQPGGSGDYP